MRLMLFLSGILAAVSLAAAGQAGVRPTDYVEQVEHALFDTCPKVLRGDIDPDVSTAVASTCLRRAPASLEQRLTHASYGRPKMLGAQIDGATISLSYAPGSSLCTVMYDGPQRNAAYNRVRAAVAEMPGLVADLQASGPEGPLTAEAFRGPLLPSLYHRITLLRGPANDDHPANLAIIGYTRD